tara:strand:- start:945 stop:1901 length:957 start_codon:yes stop_codon:yes gene_type:complete
MKITGIGLYLPPKIETAEQLSKKINKSVDWIISKTGVVERRISEIDVDEMGAIAAREALNGDKPDLILNASGVGRQVIPDTSVFFQRELNLEGVPSFSIHATCLSFLVALKAANDFLYNGSFKKILIISSDRGTKGRNFDEPESAALLGDGAAAVLVEKSNNNEGSCLEYWKMQTYSSGADLTEVRGGGTKLHPQDSQTKLSDNLFSMNGPQIYRLARKKIYKMLLEMLKDQKIKTTDIDLVIPHQASITAIEAYIHYGNFNKEQVVNVISKTGNCVAASLPMSLAMAYNNKQISRGDRLYLTGTGAGLSIISSLIKF